MALGKKKQKCNLFPVVREDILSQSEISQKAGWSITAFDLPDAWTYSQGEGVIVAVIDCGCQLNHEDLVHNILPGKNFVDPKKEPWDDSTTGHGTHVSGIICAENNDVGIVGVAPKSKVIPIKVLDKYGTGNFEKVAEAIRWAVDQKSDMICMSLGSPSPIQQVRKAIQYADKKGVPVFVAAGNAGFTKEVFFPASYKESIAIGSINENMELSKFSCSGKNIDFLAPGEKILSTVPDNWYAILSGTSMSCPFATGLAALALSCARKNGKQLHGADDYRKLFKKFTRPITSQDLKNKNWYKGFGVIQPESVMQYLTHIN